jgi:hypothetical protein
MPFNSTRCYLEIFTIQLSHDGCPQLRITTSCGTSASTSDASCVMPVVTASGNDVGTALATADEWTPGPVFVTV